MQVSQPKWSFNMLCEKLNLKIRSWSYKANQEIYF